MKIGVLLKQVPDTETKIKVSGDAIDETDVKWVINPYDEFAVEEALRLKEKVGGEVVILSAGPVRVAEAIRQALAMGADRGVRIDAASGTLDSYTTAVVLAAVAKEEGLEILFAGKQAVDDDAAQVHIGVAALLGWPHVSPVEKFDMAPDQSGVQVQRPVAGGFKEAITATLPLVIGCEKGLNEPRYASLPGIMKAKSKPIAEKKAADLLAGRAPRLVHSGYSLPPERKAGKIITGEPEDAARELVKLLREEAKVL